MRRLLGTVSSGESAARKVELQVPRLRSDFLSRVEASGNRIIGRGESGEVGNPGTLGMTRGRWMTRRGWQLASALGLGCDWKVIFFVVCGRKAQKSIC